MEKGFFTKMLNAFLQTVFTWQRKRGRRLGIKNGHTGAISFLQRATGALTVMIPTKYTPLLPSCNYLKRSC